MTFPPAPFPRTGVTAVRAQGSLSFYGLPSPWDGPAETAP